MSLSVGEPGTQGRDGWAGQGCAALFAALAGALHMRGATEVNVCACQLRDAQPGLHRKQQQRVVAPTDPTAGVRGGQQRIDLGVLEEGHHRLVAPFGWDGQHPGDRGRMLGVS